MSDESTVLSPSRPSNTAVFFFFISGSLLSVSGELRSLGISRRLTVYARGEWRTASQWGVMPVLGFQHQRNFNELVYGCDVRWYIRESSPDFLAFSAGLLGRHGDAAAINLGVLWREWTFAFSYDANLSRLASASHTIGAFEVGVVYMIAKRSAKRSSLPCPIF